MNCIVDNLSVKYTDEGTGPIMLLLHGWGTTGTDFDDLARQLRTSHRVIRLDLPGFGGSERPRQAWHVTEYATFVARFLDKIEVDALDTLVGHSFGGRIAIKGLATSVLSASRLVLIGAAGVKHSDETKNIALKAVAKSGKAILSLPVLNKFASTARKKLYKSIGSEDYINAGPMQQIFLNTINEDLSSYAQDIVIPTLLIWGSEDDQAPLADAEFYQSQIGDSHLKVVYGAGHFVHHDDQAQVSAWIEEFIG